MAEQSGHMVLLAYAPVLLLLPVLAVVGAVLVVVPGGFIIILAGVYWGSMEFAGLLALGSMRRRRARREATAIMAKARR